MNYFKEKMRIVSELRNFLKNNNFTEVHTPVLRRNSGQLIKRIKLEDKYMYSLRDSHELQLRWLLRQFESVFEIGSCFRFETEEKSTTNIGEFLLMELFTSKFDLEQIKTLVKTFILLQRPLTKFEEISIAGYIKDHLGIDLTNESQEILYSCLRKRYFDKLFENDYEYVLHYIEFEIEPLSKGKVVFFTDYPECTCSYANIKCGNIISRFELFADGLELANGFDDECNAARFALRNRDLPIFSNEEEIIAQTLEDGSLPAVSAGVGIGIERLCMFILNINDIRDLSFPSEVF